MQSGTQVPTGQKNLLSTFRKQGEVKLVAAGFV
jgi:hypothetical protein